MRKLSLEDARDRFGHVDATFVRAKCVLGGEDSEYVVRFYPWWEHPRYIQARTDSMPWRFKDTETGAREFVIRPIVPIEFKLSMRANVTDISFPEHHPILWKYEDAAQVICNSKVAMNEMFERLVARARGPVTKAVLRDYIDPLPAAAPPFSLGEFPRSLFADVCSELAALHVDFFVPREPQARVLPKLCILDGDYIVADDFEIEVPDIEHLDDWFYADDAKSLGDDVGD